MLVAVVLLAAAGCASRPAPVSPVVDVAPKPVPAAEDPSPPAPPTEAELRRRDLDRKHLLYTRDTRQLCDERNPGQRAVCDIFHGEIVITAYRLAQYQQGLVPVNVDAHGIEADALASIAKACIRATRDGALVDAVAADLCIEQRIAERHRAERLRRERGE
jgi:hypothetical protein